ncbi:MAG: hypothetical protein AMK73_09080 [Planctomycetes bacterium SM23_32]|nr:MAG: hypothetical protein AMK73_09080 [Planctomycetes bacterium SM23_32]
MAHKDVVNVGMIGCGFMGKTHSFGYRNVNPIWDPPVKAVMKCITGSRSRETCQAAAQSYGWQDYEADWQDMLQRDDIDLVDIGTPNFLHHEQALAAVEAGKDILCEKPLAMTLAEARQMTQAAEEAGVKAMCGFTYRQAPAVRLARQIIEAGEVGEVYHWRAVYLQDWIIDPEFPLVWRLDADTCGSGSLGDLAAHLIDMALLLVGDIAEVSAVLETFVKERPLVAAGGGTGLVDKRAAGQKGQVKVDDAALCCCRFANGAVGTFEATRFAQGHKNGHRWEINGSKGSLAWSLEDMNYLEFYKAGEGNRQGFRKILATEGDTPGWEAWWPAGHIIGYGELFINEIYEMLCAIAEDRQPAPSFRDGLKCQAVLDAFTQSARSKQWVPVPPC